jgi:quercetin dioxygenase-like cupin family protein
MSAPARIITNPVTGEALTWLVTSERSGGRLAKAEIRVHGAGRGNRLPHAHPSAQERFTVVRGRMAIDCGGDVTVLHPGESLTVAPGVEHAWWNARAGELCLHVEISRPGGYEVPPRRLQRLLVPPLARLGRRRHSRPAVAA